jgi:hypothetical protein
VPEPRIDEDGIVWFWSDDLLRWVRITALPWPGRRWVIVRTAPEYLDADDLMREPDRAPNPEFFDAFCEGDAEAGSVGAFKLTMVRQWLAAHGLTRVERDPDDHERIVEWWHGTFQEPQEPYVITMGDE